MTSSDVTARIISALARATAARVRARTPRSVSPLLRYNTARASVADEIRGTRGQYRQVLPQPWHQASVAETSPTRREAAKRSAPIAPQQPPTAADRPSALALEHQGEVVQDRLHLDPRW